MKPLWIFDCDNTLYPENSGFLKCVDGKIIEYMAQRLRIPQDQIGPLRERYWSEHSITLVGLMRDYSVDPADYLDFVHDVPVEEFLEPDERLKETLARLPGEKHVFTNGTVSHAERVMERLGIRSELGRVFDIGFMDYVPKPEVHGYKKMLEALGVSPGECVMVDDMAQNLDTAKKLGMSTVLVGPGRTNGHPAVREAWMVSFP